MSASYRLQSLGDLRLQGPAGELLPRRRKELALLVYLAAAAPRAIRRAELQALLWGERDEGKAQNSLRHTLLMLRRALGDDAIDVQRDQARVCSEAIVLDAREAERHHAAARYTEAADLFAGEFLPDGESLGSESFSVWVEVERARLAKLRDSCFEHIVAGHEAAADWSSMARTAGRWAELRPLEERPSLRLIAALRLASRPGDALAHASAFSSRLHAELEAEPSAEWKRTVESVRREHASHASDRAIPQLEANGTGQAATRDAVFRQIMSAWRAVREGHTRRLVVESTGEEHATLAREFARWLTQTDRNAVLIHAPLGADRDKRRPGLAELLAPLASAPGLAGAAPEDLAALADVLPAVRDRFPHLPSLATVVELAAAIARVLDAVAEEQPVALVIEELGTFDDATRDWLVDVARQCSGAVLIIFSQRTTHGGGESLLPFLPPSDSTLYLRLASPAETRVLARRRSRPLVFAAAAVAISIALGGGLLEARRFAPRVPIVAIGVIDMASAPDSLRGFPLLLETNLARVPQIQVISETRMNDVLGQLAATGKREAATPHRAAAVAGASEIIEGVLSRRARGTLRLDLRRVDVKAGTTRAAFTLESGDAFDLVDLATERIAQELGGLAPSTRFATTASSLVAYRLYEQGLRADAAADPATARRFYLSALGEDSTFAMAAFHAAQRSTTPELWTLMERAARLAKRSTERERLLILSNYASAMQDPVERAYAESLAVRFPTEPDAHLRFGAALISAGRFPDGVRELRRAIDMDSLGLAGTNARCVACDAYGSMIQAYVFADSLPAAERTARESVRRQRASAGPQLGLALALNTLGRYDEALGALQSAATLSGAPRIPSGPLTDAWLRQGRFDDVDKDWQDALAAGTRDEQIDALATATLSLRFQGRLTEALAASTRQRALERVGKPGDRWPRGDAVAEGMALFELGRFRESGLLFDSIAARRDGPSPGRIGRDVAWRLTHAATAFAAAGDTARLSLIEDTVRVFGARSSWARDQLLHLYVRGLRLRARGQLASAADAFRRSMFSLVEGNARANIELARTLLQLHRAAEAVPVLQGALAGPIGASGQYVNRTELHELLGRAYEEAGKPDSARAELRWVVAAWRRADPRFAARREEIQRHLRQAASGAR